jgi:hypothetical protein
MDLSTNASDSTDKAQTSSSDTDPESPARNGSDSEDGLKILVHAMEDTNETIMVPLAGQRNSETISTRRNVSNGCSICLCNVAVEEKLTWSSNASCSHIFHHDCIVRWLLTVGRKEQTRQLTQNSNMTDEHLDMICKFPMLCPCCRQAFIIEHHREEDNKTPNAGESEAPTSSVTAANGNTGIVEVQEEEWPATQSDRTTPVSENYGLVVGDVENPADISETQTPPLTVLDYAPVDAKNPLNE